MLSHRFLKRTIEETSENMNEENWLTFQKLEIENSGSYWSARYNPVCDRIRNSGRTGTRLE